MPNFIDTIQAILESGKTALSIKQPGDSVPRLRISSDGITQISKDGIGFDFGYGLTIAVDENENPIRSLLEMNASMPIGLCLNNSNGAAISITAEQGRLVIRDERKGRDHIIGTIGEIDENYQS